MWESLKKSPCGTMFLAISITYRLARYPFEFPFMLIKWPFTNKNLSLVYFTFLIACAGVDTPVFIRKGVRFIRGLIKQKRKNVVTVLTESSEEEKEIVILGPGTQHYIIVEDILPSPKHIFLGTRVITKHVRTGKYTFATIDTINGDKYSVTFEDKQRTKGTVAVKFIRNLYPPTFCG